eukprot:EG_transcript_11000
MLLALLLLAAANRDLPAGPRLGVHQLNAKSPTVQVNAHHLVTILSGLGLAGYGLEDPEPGKWVVGTGHAEAMDPFDSRTEVVDLELGSNLLFWVPEKNPDKLTALIITRVEPPSPSINASVRHSSVRVAMPDLPRDTRGRWEVQKGRATVAEDDRACTTIRDLAAGPHVLHWAVRYADGTEVYTEVALTSEGIPGEETEEIIGGHLSARLHHWLRTHFSPRHHLLALLVPALLWLALWATRARLMGVWERVRRRAGASAVGHAPPADTNQHHEAAKEQETPGPRPAAVEPQDHGAQRQHTGSHLQAPAASASGPSAVWPGAEEAKDQSGQHHISSSHIQASLAQRRAEHDATHPAAPYAARHDIVG